MKKVSAELQARIQQLHNEGISIPSIMQQLSLSRSFVYRVLGDAGQVQRSSIQKDMTPEILRKYSEGKTVYEVAAELGLGKSTVHRAVASLNAVRPKIGCKNPGVAKALRKSDIVDGLKLCTKCGKRKFPEQFPPSTVSSDGRRPRCNVCHDEDSNKWRKTELGAKYRRMMSRTYEHRIRQAMPKWVDREALKAVYMEAVLKQEAEGVPYEVDHEVPIRGRNVSGLHVPWNLKIITAVENARKGNKHKEH